MNEPRTDNAARAAFLVCSQPSSMAEETCLTLTFMIERDNLEKVRWMLRTILTVNGPIESIAQSLEAAAKRLREQRDYLDAETQLAKESP